MTDEGRPASRSDRHRRGRQPVVPAEDAIVKNVPVGHISASAGAAGVPGIEALRPPPARSARRADQRAGRRRRRTRMVLALVAVVALVGAGVVAAVNRRQQPEATTTPTAIARTQRTLLLQVPGPTGDAQASALLVTDSGTGKAAMVLVPSLMLSQVPGFGAAPFGEALRLGGADGAQLSKDTLANQLGVTVDHSFAVSPAALAALVDAVGGVEVEVDVDLPGGTESSGVVLRQGKQALGGQQAAAFATYGVPGQPELGRLTRLQLVLGGVLDKMAVTPLRTAPVPTPVVDSLQALARARAAQELSYEVLPVTDIDNGSDQETTRLDTDRLATLIGSHLAMSVPANAFRPENRVVVRNGVGTAGAGQTVTRRLNAAGFVVVQTGNADNFDYPRSLVLIFDSGDRAVSAGEAVAAALGLAPDAVQVSDLEQSVAEVIVTVGKDYVPPSAGTAPSAGVSGSPGVGP